MFINFNKIIFFLAISIQSINSYAQVVAPDIQSLFIEEQLNKIKSAASPANIHINVDAKSYINNFNSNNVKNNKSNNTKNKTSKKETNSNNIEIKDNTGSTINTDVAKEKTVTTEISESPITTTSVLEPVINNEATAVEPVTSTTPTTVVPAPEAVSEVVSQPLTETAEVSVEESFAEAAPATPEAFVITPVELSPEIIISEPVATEPLPVDLLPTEVLPTETLPVEPVAIEATTVHTSRFSIRGFYTFGNFTSISDISSNYSLGFAVGYDLNPLMRIELQYSFSEYEDDYVYNYSALVSGYKFNQNDFAGILNYKILKDENYNVYARTGLNYSFRSAHNFYTGDTNSSNSLGFVLGLGADYKVADNLSLTGNLDYILSLTSSGYNDIASPLYLVENESFMTFSFGLKYNF